MMNQLRIQFSKEKEEMTTSFEKKLAQLEHDHLQQLTALQEQNQVLELQYHNA